MIFSDGNSGKITGFLNFQKTVNCERDFQNWDFRNWDFPNHLIEMCFDKKRAEQHTIFILVIACNTLK